MQANLVQYLHKNGKLGEKESAQILVQIVELVETSHHDNIPCLNLLAENIIIDRNKHVQVLDRKEKQYCSILHSDEENSLACDIWALGLLLRTMLVGSTLGSLPFKSVSEECRNLLSRMLVLRPSQRATISEVKSHPFLRKLELSR